MIQIEDREGFVHLTLNRPERRNAMSLAMVDQLLEALEGASDARAVVLRGAGGHFCAGGDIADMQAAASGGVAGIAAMNRRFGTLLEAFAAFPGPTVSLCEGAVMGGGFGLACVTDLTVVAESARFRLPETGLGISPAQIAPFIALRVGRSQALRLAVTGETLGPEEALAVGLAHRRMQDWPSIAKRMRRGEPGAVRATKELMKRTGVLSDVLDAASEDFARLALRPEAQQGMLAFLQKEDPPWA